MILMLADHPALGSYDVSSLKNVNYGASPISEAVLGRVTAALPKAQFTQAYGMTELSPAATFLHWKGQIGDGRAKRPPQGRWAPTLGCELRVVDADDKPVPYGTVGEIVVRGDNLMMGYWERPEETARAVIDGWMRTGDGGYMDEDGFIYVVDRIEDMIISGGEKTHRQLRSRRRCSGYSTPQISLFVQQTSRPRHRFKCGRRHCRDQERARRDPRQIDPLAARDAQASTTIT
jgi:long-chain acyl-CoA synthetase